MKILIACEMSGVVRSAFEEKGHACVSIDLLPDLGGSPNHVQDDVLHHLDESWDMMIAFPPCTHLAVSGARWFKEKEEEQAEAIKFVETLWTAAIPRICIENPVGVLSTRSMLGKPDQIIHPWMFGDAAEKRTCLWLKNLPPLRPTTVVKPPPRHVTKSGRTLPKWYNLPPSPERAILRSITFPGIAKAMAEQWG